MRVFLAIELSDALRAQLEQLGRALQAAQPPLKLKWVAPQNQHLTLHFFGELEPRALEQIVPALQQATADRTPFELSLAELGCFPNSHRPNVLWLGLRDEHGVLQALQRAVASALARIGYPPESRAFAPHLTLARVPRHARSHDKKELGAWFLRQPAPAPQRMSVDALHLVRSELLPAGPRYTMLQKIEFADKEP